MNVFACRTFAILRPVLLSEWSPMWNSSSSSTWSFRIFQILGQRLRKYRPKSKKDCLLDYLDPWSRKLRAAHLQLPIPSNLRQLMSDDPQGRCGSLWCRTFSNGTARRSTCPERGSGEVLSCKYHLYTVLKFRKPIVSTIPTAIPIPQTAIAASYYIRINHAFYPMFLNPYVHYLACEVPWYLYTPCVIHLQTQDGEKSTT